MKSKKMMLAVFGLLVVGIALFFGKQMVYASPEEGKKFDDWSVACAKDDKKKKICFLTQQVTAVQENDKDKKPQVIAVYQIGYFNGGVLKMMQIVPLGVNLQSGTSIISGKALIAPGKFLNCVQSGCNAVAEISSSDLKTMLGNSDNSVALIGSDGKQFNLPISVKGLKEGLEDLK